MPRLISADVLDSTRDDWTITDDGDDRGPTTSWPAPRIRHDDRTPALGPAERMTRSGLPDAYAFLRMKDDPPAHRMLDDRDDPPPRTPFADAMGLMLPVPPDGNMRGIPQYRTVPKPPRMIDARYAGVDVYEAGMLIRRMFSGEARGIPGGDAGMLIRRFLSRADAGALDECGAVPTMPTSPVARSSYRAIPNWLHKWANGGKLPPDQAARLNAALEKVVASTNWTTFNEAKTASFDILRATSNNSRDKVDHLTKMWRNLEGGVPKERGFLGKIGQGIEGAVTGVGEGAYAIGKGIAKPVVALATSPVKLATDIVKGKNVFESLKDTVKRDFSSVKEVAPYAQAVISFVPGVGAGVNAAIAAGAAIAQGQPITSALVAGVKNALPGGPLAAQAFDTAYQIARGENVGEAALQALVNQVPGGELGKAAAQAAIAVAKGQNLQQAALGVAKTALQGSGIALPGGPLAAKAALDLVSGGSVKDIALGAAQSQLQKVAGQDVTKAASDVLSGKSLQDVALGAAKDKMVAFTEKLSPFAVSPMNATGPRILNTLRSQALPPMIPREVKLAAESFLQTPALRSLPIAEVARRLNVPAHVARAGAASVLQSVQRSGGSTIPMLAHAPGLEQQIPFHATFDQMMSKVASRAAPPTYSHNANTARSAQLRKAASVFSALQAHGLGAGALDPKLMPTIRQGSTGEAVIAWQKIIGVTADGQFGPQTTAATKSFQQKKGLVADGIVGPQSWLAGLGSVISAPTVPGAPPSGPLPPPPPQATPVLTGAMPIIKRGSTGAPVKTWQAFLGIAADGIFGPDTEAKTRTYQSQNGLVADGIVGPNTWAKAMSGTGTAPPAPTGGGGPVIVSTPPITLPPIIPGTPPIVVPPVVITEPPPGSPPGTPPIITTTTPPGFPPFPTTSQPATPPNPPGQPPAPPPITTSPPGQPPVVLPPPNTPPTSKASMVPVVVGLGLLAFLMAGSSSKIIKF